jgi:hypothetical protein
LMPLFSKTKVLFLGDNTKIKSSWHQVLAKICSTLVPTVKCVIV